MVKLAGDKMYTLTRVEDIVVGDKLIEADFHTVTNVTVDKSSGDRTIECWDGYTIRASIGWKMFVYRQTPKRGESGR